MSLENCDFLADGHVHVYRSMSVETLLDAASQNLFKLRGPSPGEGTGLLLIADPEGVRGYERILNHGNERGSSGRQTKWSRESSDDRSVVFRRASGTRIVAIRGQQLITREGLEVLGAGYGHQLPSGLTLATTVERIRVAGGFSMIPWGVGKWWGRRGRLVTNMIIAERGSSDIMLADNGGRPWCWARVPQFEMAKEQGMRIVAGTDPLPLKGEETRVGSYGFRIQFDRAEDQSIADAFRGALENPSIPIQILGKRMGLRRFVSSQFRLRLRP